MATRLRSGIIGTGFMGQVHAAAVRAAGGIVSTVASRTAEGAAAAADRFAADRSVTSASDLISADDVDIVHICTPNSSHAELAQKAIAAGKHVICEKPLAISPEEAQVLVDAAARAGVVTAVPFVYRFYASVREVRARIRRGDAGPLRLVHGSYLQDWLSRSEESNWRVDPAQGGASRAFGDIGVHWCDLVEFVTGHRITRVNASLFMIQRGGDAPAGTEDAATVMFSTDLGALGSVVISQVSPGRKNRLWFSVDGSDVSYQFDQENPDALWIGAREQNTILPRAAGGAIAPARFDQVPVGHPQGYQDSFTAFLRDVHSSIRESATDGLPTFTDGLRAATLTAAVLVSANSQSWVDVPPLVRTPTQ